MKTGVYSDLSNKEYHAAPGISKSGLDLIARAPEFYRRRYIDGIEEGKAAHFAEGSLFHTLTLEPEKVESEFAVLPEDFNGRTKDGKRQKKEMEQSGLTVVSAEQYKKCLAMATAVRGHEKSLQLLAGGLYEHSIFWEEDVLCKCRPDIIREDIGALIDLKSSRCASYAAFKRAIGMYRYHVQAAHYLIGANNAGVHAKKFVFIVVEKEPPYLVAVYELGEESIETGATIRENDMATYARCLKENKWPGYPEKIQVIDIQPWLMKN